MWYLYFDVHMGWVKPIYPDRRTGHVHVYNDNVLSELVSPEFESLLHPWSAENRCSVEHCY